VSVAPVGSALRVAKCARKAEVYRSRGDHYGVYQGGEDYDRVISAEVEFLHRQARLSGATVRTDREAAARG
jgi:uncharacterized protein